RSPERDHRLGGKVLQGGYLLLGEGPNLLALPGNGSEQRILLPRRHAQHGSATADVDERPAGCITPPITLVIGDISDLHDGIAPAEPIHRRARTGSDTPAVH